MLPENLGATVINGTWPILPIFKALEKYGNLEREEMFNIFNMGIGLIVTVHANDVDKAIRFFEECGEKAYKIGTVVKGEGVQFVDEGKEQ